MSQHDRINDRAKQRRNDIEDSLGKVQHVNDELKMLRRKVDDAVTAADSLKPVASNPAQIKEQQEELKVHLRNLMSPYLIKTKNNALLQVEE